MNEHQYQIVLQMMDQLKAVESALARFYSICASSFPQDKDLWDGLARDEEEHARLVDELRQIVTERRAECAPEKFNPALLNTYLFGIKAEVDRLKKGEMGRRQALNIAKDYEHTLVENKFFKVIQSPLAEYEQISRRIEQETQAHFQRLLRYFQEKFQA